MSLFSYLGLSGRSVTRYSVVMHVADLLCTALTSADLSALNVHLYIPIPIVDKLLIRHRNPIRDTITLSHWHAVAHDTHQTRWKFTKCWFRLSFFAIYIRSFTHACRYMTAWCWFPLSNSSTMRNSILLVSGILASTLSTFGQVLVDFQVAQPPPVPLAAKACTVQLFE